MNLIAVLNITDKVGFSKTTNSIESIRRASNRWKSDFIEIGDLKYQEYNKNTIRKSGDWNGFSGTKIWQIIWILENFSNYDKILILDSDVFINSEAPNIFDLISNEYDIAAVLDGNPGRLDNVLYKKSIDIFSQMNGCIEHFKHLNGFNTNNYINNYINTGVVLYNMNKFSNKIKDLKNQIIEKKEIYNYIEEHNSPIDQNLLSAWISSNKDINLKILDNTWNWISPDITQEYDEFLGRMKKMIYHFCGTNLIKERMVNYDRWK
jgi:lipopolysaccharide biosynthesis glycosyltransferase